jgi:hypothetical protein
VPKPYLFSALGIALSEKQIPQVIENNEKRSERMEALERAGVLRRQDASLQLNSGSRSFNFGLFQSNVGPIQGRDK